MHNCGIYKQKLKDNYNKGFTLVELVVVLVILAILAAILVPALLGYIDEAKTKQYLLDAKNMYTATQSELSKIYSVRGKYKVDRSYPNDTNKKAFNVFENGRGQNSGAIAGVYDYGASRDIFRLAGYAINDPYPNYLWYQKCNNSSNNLSWTINADSPEKDVSFLCVGVGSYDTYLDPKNSLYDPHKAYTVYFMIFQPYEGADFYLFDGHSLIDYWPFEKKFSESFDSGNKYKYKLKIDKEDIIIQFLVLKNGNNTKQITRDTARTRVDDYYK